MAELIELPHLASPARRALENAGIHYLNDLNKYREGELVRLHGIGPNALKTIKDALKKNQIHLGDEMPCK